MKHAERPSYTLNIAVLHCEITLWNFSFRAFHEIQFQGDFMKHKIFSQWQTNHLWVKTPKMEQLFRNYQTNHKFEEKGKDIIVGN